MGFLLLEDLCYMVFFDIDFLIGKVSMVLLDGVLFGLLIYLI